MADLDAARKQIGYARKEIAAGTPDEALPHLDKAEEFIARAEATSAAEVPGFADVDEDLQKYWANKLGTDFTNTGNPEPAKSLVQWREVARTGTYLPNQGETVRYPAPANDVAIGLAWAEAYAKANGVTEEQITSAEAELHATYPNL